MATVRDGDGTALVVVDVQVGVVDMAWEADRVVGNVATAVDRARAAGVPVVWVQHDDDELPRDSAAWQWAPPLRPRADEVLVHKSHNSSFEATDLEERLAELEVSRVVLAGAATNWCIRATAYGALSRGYDLTLVGDAHTATDHDPPGGLSRVPMLVEDLNTVMEWISYPGVDTTVTRAADLFS